MSGSTMAKAYEPRIAEDKWYTEWESRGYFQAHPESPKEPYTIVIPPPNVTGVLTLGHVLNNTLQDILIRWEKMRGKEICWVPGTDHAGIATQAKVEAALLQEEGKSRYDLGRKLFLEKVWQWKEKYGGTITRQLRSLGVACDWRRECFTLDPELSQAVIEVFIRLYDKGLIYRGRRMINWCPKSHTALSDEEVIYRKNQGSLWYFRYPLVSGEGHLVVATTRPETMLGDTAVAVHPDDERYQAMIGKRVRLPLVNREIPIIADSYVDKSFGTGAVKITPAHDPNDYEMALRHGLEIIDILTADAKMNELAGPAYRGMDRYECRKRVVADLQQLGLIDKIEDYEHQVGYSERGHVAVEPKLSQQWFVRMPTLAEPALQAVRDGRIKFYPDRWVKTYYHWLENIKDWCISRQLWWGHRIPAYYCDQCAHVVVARNMPASCPRCQHPGLTQDEDVLDTWFSSWLWPFSVFKWPGQSRDLAHFYPTQSLVTGPDIIFFWVARMIMAGLEFMGDIPFKDVYFTSIIRDNQGRKLSKSLNNSPDPLDVIATYGADALRYSVIYIAPVGQDIRYSNEKCEIGRNFANKLWNAARFRQIQGDLSAHWQDLSELDGALLRSDDRWILYRTHQITHTITQNLTNFDFHGYAINLYEFVWNEFCDWYVESAKAVFYSENPDQKQSVLHAFDHILSVILRLMHPIMPFVTEEIYHHLGYASELDSIMLASWPTSFDEVLLVSLRLSESEANMVEEKFNLIKQGRNLRGAYNIPFTQKVSYLIKPTQPEFSKLLEDDIDSLRKHLNADAVTVDGQLQPDSQNPSAVGKYAIISMPLVGVIDFQSEIQRLEKQHQEIYKLLSGIAAKLDNEKFLARAPAEVVTRERERQQEYTDKLHQVGELLVSFQQMREKS